MIAAAWDWRLIVLSYVIAALASYTALDLADRVIKTSRAASRRAWLSAGALVMGVGIWSMHFTGMLAFQPSAMSMSYDVGVTVLSALAAVAASGAALFAVSRAAMSRLHLAVGGMAMGVGIVSMHYIGMASMRMPADISYYAPLVALSIAIAVGASLAALRLAARFSREGSHNGAAGSGALWLKGAAGLLMGAAIVGMHYTGMAAARFTPDGSPQNGAAGVDNIALGGAVGSSTLMVLGVALVCSMMDRRFASQAVAPAETEQIYASLFEQSVDALLVHDRDGYMVDCNSEACRSLGYTREELLSMRVSDFATNLATKEDKVAEGQTLWQRAMDTEPGQVAGVHEGEHVRRDGTSFPVEVRVGSADYGGERMMFASASDVTERKAAEEALRQSERRNQTIMQAHPDLVFRLSRDGEYLDFQANRDEDLYVPSEEIIGSNLRDIMPAEVADGALRHLALALRTGKMQVYEYSLPTPDAQREFEARLLASNDEEVVCLVRDITERKRADEEIRRLNEELEERVERRTTELTATLSRYEQSVARERALRGASAALVAAPDRDGIYAAALEAVLPFTDEAAGTRVSIWSGSGEKDVCVGASGDRAAEIEGKETFIGEFPDWARLPLMEGRPVEIFTAEAEEFQRAFTFETKLGTLCMVPMFVRGRFEGRIVVASDSSLSGEIRYVLEALGSQVALALERADLIENLHQRQGEERFRALIQNSSDVIMILDENTAVSYVSPTVHQVFGHNVAAGDILAFVHPDDVARARGFLEDTLISPDGVSSTELRIQHADGSWRYAEWRGSNLLDDPAVGGLVVNARDITERKAAEEALRHSEERFRSVYDNTSLGIAVTGLDGRHRYANPEMCEMLGYSEEELRSMTIAEITHPDDLQTSAEHRRRLVEGEVDSYELEKRYLHADGHTVWISLNVSLAKDSEGERQFIAQIQGITERKQRESELREAEERFRSAFENAAIGMALTHAEDLSYLRVNRALCGMLGYSEEELLTLSARELTHPDDREETLNHAQRCREGEAESHVLEKRYLHADGHTVWVSTGVSLVRDAGGHPLYFVVQMQDVTKRKELEEELQHRAFHDPLTGLPNRALFNERLERALVRARRSRESLAVLFLDLDNFKLINDSLSHDVGDGLLVEVAERIRYCLRQTDTAARLGGDEFTVLVEGISDDSRAAAVAERIADALDEPFDIAGHELPVTFSIGIAVSVEGSGEASDLLSDADVAMYRAKNCGKARYAIFDSNKDAHALRRLDSETELRRAVERDELRVRYQPVFSLETRGIAGMEALVRWEHPERGLLSPADFIPLAEETGLIVPLGRWVLEEACRQAREWQDRYPNESRPIMGVNLSLRQFQSTGLAEEVARILHETGLDPAHLALEVTESIAMHDVDSTVATLGRLKALGVWLVIDDFGSGNSSLSYLTGRFQMDHLKIDGSFVREFTEDTEDSLILPGLIEFAHTIGFKVIAEGVETSDQLRRLREMGCEFVQGYYIAKPLTAAAATELLSEGFPSDAKGRSC